MSLTDVENELLDLRDEVYDLRQSNKKLMEALIPTGAVYPHEWGLTAQQATVLTTLWMSLRPISIESLETLLRKQGSIAKKRILPVIILNLRQRTGLTISTIFGFGYEMPPESKTALTDIVQKRQAFFGRKRKRQNKPIIPVDSHSITN